MNRNFFQPTKILLVIFGLGLLLRLLGLINITLAGDFAYHWQQAGQIVSGQNLPLLGPSASMDAKFNLGPFYYYLLAIPYALSGGNYLGAIIFFAIINSVSILGLYQVCKQWFGSIISLKITALYALSSYMIVIQSFPWNPYILPSLTILSLYCLTQIQIDKFKFMPLLFLSLGLSLQAHATAIFLFPGFFLLLPIKKLPIKYLLLGIGIFILTLSPWLYVDLTTNFSQTRAAGQILMPKSGENCALSYYLANHGHGESCFAQIRNSLFVSRLFAMSLFGTTNLIVSFLTMVLL